VVAPRSASGWRGKNARKAAADEEGGSAAMPPEGKAGADGRRGGVTRRRAARHVVTRKAATRSSDVRWRPDIRVTCCREGSQLRRSALAGSAACCQPAPNPPPPKPPGPPPPANHSREGVRELLPPRNVAAVHRRSSEHECRSPTQRVPLAG